MNLIIKLVEIVANITLSISNIFSLIHVKIIDKFEININKPKHEDEILSNTTETNENVKILLSDKEEELKKLRDREKIIREIITKEKKKKRIKKFLLFKKILKKKSFLP